jgi:hypothetical protein
MSRLSCNLVERRQAAVRLGYIPASRTMSRVNTIPINTISINTIPITPWTRGIAHTPGIVNSMIPVQAATEHHASPLRDNLILTGIFGSSSAIGAVWSGLV